MPERTTASPAAETGLPLPSRADDRRQWGRLAGSSLSLTLAEAVAQHPGLVVVITAGTQTGARLEEELGFFLSAGRSSEHDSSQAPAARILWKGFIVMTSYIERVERIRCLNTLNAVSSDVMILRTDALACAHAQNAAGC